MIFIQRHAVAYKKQQDWYSMSGISLAAGEILCVNQTERTKVPLAQILGRNYSL